MSLLRQPRAWQLTPPDPARAEGLARACGIHPLVAQLLLNRGIDTSRDADRFLSPTLECLTDPLALHDMAKALERLERARRLGEPVLIFGDSDVDGVTAAAILFELLQQLGIKAVVRLSNRLRDGYGFPDRLLARVLRNEARLVVLVDCGTNQPEAIQALAGCGIDTIILDHHLPAGIPAEPAALVNPRCGRGPGRELCSAGLAFKLVQAFHPMTGWPLEACLDLAALGTLADYAPLVGDSRILVSEGLPRIFASQRPGLRQLLEDVALSKPTAEQVLRRLVPRLNAYGRLGEPRPVWQMLIEPSIKALAKLSAVLGDAHATTKSLHRRILIQAHGHADRLHLRDELVMVIGQRGWHPGIMGPVAAQLAERFTRPAIAVALDGTLGVGSGRSVPGFNLFDALQACEGLLVRYGGHAQACGLTIHAEELPRFREAINRHARTRAAGQELARPMAVDLEVTIADLGDGLAEGIEQLKPFGAGNPPPLVLIRQAACVRDEQGSWLVDATGRLRLTGRLAGMTPDERYDVLVEPSATSGRAGASVVDVRLAVDGEAAEVMRRAEAGGAGLSAPVRS